MSYARLVAALSATALLTGAAHAAGGFPQPSICSRSCWGARAPGSLSTNSTLNRAVIHHTAGASDYNTSSQSTSASIVRSIQNYHMDTQGWSDIGYHFLVDKLGNRFEGRSGSLTTTTRKGAHDGVNTNSYGFNIMGYYHTPYNQTPTSVSRNAMYDLIAWRMPNGFSAYGGSAYGASSSAGYICGHRVAKATACPGDLLYAYVTDNNSGGEARNAVNSRINSTPVEVIVDNGTSAFVASTNWIATTSTPGYYGSNYQYRSCEAISDQAKWQGNIPVTDSYTVYARWTAGTNRATSAPFAVYHAGGTTTVNVNQQNNNNAWVSLGTYTFNSGSGVDRVGLSCWTTSGTVVVADAVKFVQQ